MRVCIEISLDALRSSTNVSAFEINDNGVLGTHEAFVDYRRCANHVSIRQPGTQIPVCRRQVTLLIGQLGEIGDLLP